MKTIATRTASRNMATDIAKVSYEGQPDNHKQHVTGYEDLFEQLPIMLQDDDRHDSQLKLVTTQLTMRQISQKVMNDDRIVNIDTIPKDNEFKRVIVAMEEPTALPKVQPFDSDEPIEYQEGAEIVVALWGKGRTSPVHGHSVGYMHEELLLGKLRVNTYRIVNQISKTVRRVATHIIEGKRNVFVSQFTKENKYSVNKRETLVHNFVALETTASLHYLPEHTRDGRDNVYDVEEFSDVCLFGPDDVKRLSAQEALYLPPGEVALVRSSNVSDYGDHFIVYTGPPVMKEHGLRPQEVAIQASEWDNKLLDRYEPKMGLVLLHLNPHLRDLFLEFHGITVEGKTVTFPEV